VLVDGTDDELELELLKLELPDDWLESPLDDWVDDDADCPDAVVALVELTVATWLPTARLSVPKLNMAPAAMARFIRCARRWASALERRVTGAAWRGARPAGY
jgi:hypothetical protein